MIEFWPEKTPRETTLKEIHPVSWGNFAQPPAVMDGKSFFSALLL